MNPRWDTQGLMTLHATRDAKGHGRISKTAVHLSQPVDQAAVCLTQLRTRSCLQDLRIGQTLAH